MWGPDARRVKRRLLALAALVLLAVAGLAGRRLGTFLVDIDPLEKADVIYVLGGTFLERPLEAVDLYHEGWAPRILLSAQVVDNGVAAARARGVEVPTEPEMQIVALERLGVPRDAIDVLAPQGTTAEEARALAALARERGWTKVIVVTSKEHTRRAGLAMRRQVAGRGVAIIMRASRYDEADPAHWWRDRGTLSFTLFEAQRYAAYWIGWAD